MSDVRRLMGRLYPPGMKYTVGFGGRPTIAPEDITGALGFIRDRFARETFCALWWPEGASLTRREFDLELRDRQMREWTRRQRALVVARLAVDVAHDEVGAHGAVHGVRRALAAARAELETARSKAWPPWHRPLRIGDVPQKQSRYAAIRAAVLAEIADPRSCKVCAGRGTLRADALIVKCDECGGTGQRARSESGRAKAIGLTPQSYGRWAQVYEWTYTLVKTADETAANVMKANMESDEAVKTSAIETDVS